MALPSANLLPGNTRLADGVYHLYVTYEPAINAERSTAAGGTVP